MALRFIRLAMAFISSECVAQDDGQVRPLPLQVMHTFLPLQVGQVSSKNPFFPDPPQFGHRPFPLQVEQTPMEHFPEAVAA